MDDWERAEAIAAEARAEIEPAVRRMRRWMRLEQVEEVLVAPAVRIRRLFTLPFHLFVGGVGFVTVSLVPILLIVGLILLLSRCG
jgi:hypothetical protein